MVTCVERQHVAIRIARHIYQVVLLGICKQVVGNRGQDAIERFVFCSIQLTKTSIGCRMLAPPRKVFFVLGQTFWSLLPLRVGMLEPSRKDKYAMDSTLNDNKK